ncbi:acyl-CoA carboxylase epsilon subunit [Amycolatopsis samaneae]|uniref:Acyl-CoA carboxylase epsilon subunit n=1 Tax=Amycolatopsis samaneae TaxID=664691 RepID=A0ABW5GTE2_9PSEU
MGERADESTVDSPELRVERGAPDEVELAALVAVLAGLSAAAAARRADAGAVGDRPRIWADAAWRPGAPLRAAHGTWRASLLPR